MHISIFACIITLTLKDTQKFKERNRVQKLPFEQTVYQHFKTEKHRPIIIFT